LKRRKHSPTIQQFPYFLPPIGVAEPFGGDTLVACVRTPHPLAAIAGKQRTIHS